MAKTTSNNPIAYIVQENDDGTTTNITVPNPSTFQWSLADISSDDAGRTEDTVMHKNRIGQCVTISLAWAYLTTEEASVVLKAFNEEYLDINYLDPMEGGYVTTNFYVGDRSAPLYNIELGLWQKISFKIIETSGVDDTDSTEE